MKITGREVVAASGLAIAGAAVRGGSALAQHEGHGGAAPQAAPSPRSDATTGPQWSDIVKGTRHPARTIEPGTVVPPASQDEITIQS
jgi:hypothetical protein